MIKRILNILKKPPIVIIALLIIISIVGQVWKYLEKDDVNPLGMLVEIDDKKMHVYSQGQGNKTIVLMPGLGTTAPSIDFKPLIEELKNNFKVVVVEPFGYGFSDETSKERSVENIISEIRMTLREANIDGPYILMPHSISGIYAEYYASVYPEEVEAIIMLDTTLTSTIIEESDNIYLSNGKKQYIIASIGNFLGIDRIFYNNIYKDEECFSEKDKNDLVKMGVQNTFNKTIANEDDMELKNCETVNETKRQDDLPILKFIAIKSMADINNEKNIDIVNENLNEFDKYSNFNYCTLEGGHYIFYTKSKEIARETIDFLDKYYN